MKKYLLFALIFCCLMYSASVMAASGGAPAAAGQGGYTGPSTTGGGYTGPGIGLKSVEEAKKLADDAYVIVRGQLVQHVGKDKYLLRDASGSIEVEIDRDKWGGQEVGPQDMVEIHGEVDKDIMSVKIDAKRVVKITK